MEKAKKIIGELVDTIALILPVGWVIACYSGATEYLLAGDFIRFFGDVFVHCIAAILLLGFGFWFSEYDLKPAPSSRLPVGRWVALGIEILVLLLITLYIN